MEIETSDEFYIRTPKVMNATTSYAWYIVCFWRRENNNLILLLFGSAYYIPWYMNRLFYCNLMFALVFLIKFLFSRNFYVCYIIYTTISLLQRLIQTTHFERGEGRATVGHHGLPHPTLPPFLGSKNLPSFGGRRSYSKFQIKTFVSVP